MPDISRMFPKRFLDANDLPQDGSVVPVTIHQVYLDGFTAGGGGRGPMTASPEWRLRFAEFAKPVSLRPKRAKEIAAILGSENTDHWIGKRIGIYAGWYEAYGEQKWGILISQQPVDQLPVVHAPHAVAAGSAPALPSRAQSLGADSAAELCALLEERGKTWDDLRLHLNAAGFGELISGRLPPECPVAIKSAAWTYIRDIPKTKPKPDGSKFKALWAPPPAAAGEVVDRATGEVINPTAGLKPGAAPVQPADDIPF